MRGDQTQRRRAIGHAVVEVDATNAKHHAQAVMHIAEWARTTPAQARSGVRILVDLDLQARADIAAARARGVRALRGAAVRAERGVRGLDRLMSATAAGTARRAAERRNHVLSRFESVESAGERLARRGAERRDSLGKARALSRLRCTGCTRRVSITNSRMCALRHAVRFAR